MDNEGRESQTKSNWQPTVAKPSATIFFLNKDIVRLIHSNRANNICVIYNIMKDKEQTMLYSDFKKHRKRAYTVKNTLKIFNRSRIQMERWIKKGIIAPPTGVVPGGKRVFGEYSYFSEDDLFTIREILATIHTGRPRKDGRINARKNIPTEQELRSLLGDAIMLYTKTKSGEFVPVWTEETW